MYRNWINARLLFAPDGDGSGGSNGESLPESVVKAFEKLLDRKGGDTSAVAMMLFDENKRYRDKINELTGKVPVEGAVVLNAADAQAWEAYKALGTHEEVKQAVEQRGQLQGQLDSLARESAIRDAAAAAGYKFTVLQDRDEVARLKGKALSYAVREIEKDGTKAKVAFVKDGDTEKPLSDYAQEHWGEFMPSLVVQGTEQQNGTPYPAQFSGTGGNQKPVDVVAAFQQEQAEKAKAAKNPLLKN
jgi:hypothetical protein